MMMMMMMLMMMIRRRRRQYRARGDQLNAQPVVVNLYRNGVRGVDAPLSQ